METSDKVEFGPADVFEPGEVLNVWHPGGFFVCDEEGKPTEPVQKARLGRLGGSATLVCVVRELRRVEGEMPSIQYLVSLAADTEARVDSASGTSRPTLSKGTLFRVSSPHLERLDRDDGPHALNKAGWCI
jgi:hypothetical protein